MAGGVFYREFTKYNGFTGMTALGKVHTHLFLLGMLVFLVVALYAARAAWGKTRPSGSSCGPTTSAFP